MIDSSPFVPIPFHVSARELSSAKPMLFLAILTVASWQDHQRQLALDRLYRTELAQRTIIQPRRTLSLLQSIVVYLSWYHFIFSHKTQQTVTLLQLAIGMALDLNLHQKSKRLLVDLPGRPPPQEPAAVEQRERQRTYLGCYHLSSALAGGLAKPNLLKYSEYMASCGKRLRDDLEYPSDELIARLIPLRRMDDQAHESFYSEETFDLPFTDSRIFMSLRFLETQMDDWRRENVSDRFRQALDLSYAFAEMQLYSIGLRPPPPSLSWQPADSNQLKALLSALEAGKRFFDMLLAFPASDYHLIPFSEWMRLPFVVITVSRLCIPSDAHAAMQWDVKAAQERVRLDLYLESLCYRMQGLSTYDKVKQPHPDFWWAMRMIMDLTRAWYVRKIKGENASTSSTVAHNFLTPDTMQTTSSSAGPGCIMSPADGNSMFSLPGAHGATNGMSGHMGQIVDPVDHGERDPFAFMRSMDFDMDQFLDMGIWGHESYEAMRFGGGGGS
ncbi:hypothetical protein BDV96DRAFT_106241 [Lophiotrema nucula]|uniref:Xylanolytic transcriptional activator regulatory domain-containing protein n=1 Tax=Lophiotrema nucula TaxID=690887 RepID=A0A6A5Z6K8_9PLEO|nr:hypothetical protein BDV96DRAFT_106241 [Lophiotrema nucula]